MVRTQGLQAAAAEEQRLVNGVDTQALARMMSTIKGDPRTAAFEFRSSTQWKSGALVASTFAGYKQDGLYFARPVPHELGCDEPVALLGTGAAVGPTGHLLHALSHSLAVTMVYYAAARGLKINALRIDAEGSLDLQGLLGLDARVRPGFKHIHLAMYVESPNSNKEIRDLFQYAQGRSPIVATVAQAVNLEWTFDIEESAGAAETGDFRHGVNINDLVATVGAVQQTPVLAKCKFYGSAEWQGGARVKSTSPGFDQAEGDLLIQHRDSEPQGYVGDEPAALLGSDSGPSAAEALLQAMAGCISVTTSYHAAARGIRLDALDVDFAGDMDLQGFADVNDTVSPGYQNIRGRVYVKAGGSREEIEEFMKFTTSHSPMCNSVARPVQLTFSLEHGPC